jgi:hypothetical protein
MPGDVPPGVRANDGCWKGRQPLSPIETSDAHSLHPVGRSGLRTLALRDFYGSASAPALSAFAGVPRSQLDAFLQPPGLGFRRWLDRGVSVRARLSLTTHRLATASVRSSGFSPPAAGCSQRPSSHPPRAATLVSNVAGVSFTPCRLTAVIRGTSNCGA